MQMQLQVLPYKARRVRYGCEGASGSCVRTSLEVECKESTFSWIWLRHVDNFNVLEIRSSSVKLPSPYGYSDLT